MLLSPFTQFEIYSLTSGLPELSYYTFNWSLFGLLNPVVEKIEYSIQFLERLDYYTERLVPDFRDVSLKLSQLNRLSSTYPYASGWIVVNPLIIPSRNPTTIPFSEISVGLSLAHLMHDTPEGQRLMHSCINLLYSMQVPHNYSPEALIPSQNPTIIHFDEISTSLSLAHLMRGTPEGQYLIHSCANLFYSMQVLRNQFPGTLIPLSQYRDDEIHRMFLQMATDFFFTPKVITNLLMDAVKQRPMYSLQVQPVTEENPLVLIFIIIMEMLSRFITGLVDVLNFILFLYNKVIVYYLSAFLNFITITNIQLILILGLSLIILLQFIGTRKLKIKPKYWQVVVENFYNFLLNLTLAQAGPKSLRFFSGIYTIFFFILIFNLLGLLPFGFTVTGHIILTFTLAISFFIAWIIVAFQTLGLSFFHIFLPRNIPKALAPLLVVIEILSFSIRPISLAIRLFANMLAGHILLFIISTAVLILSNLTFFIGFIPFIFVIIFFILELGIAFLQAYVFTILLAIYLHDALYVH